MGKKTTPKKPGKFPIYLVLFMVLGYLFTAGNTSASSYNRAMKSQLNRETATGTKIVTYHVEDEEYSDKYLPRSVKAKDAADVGAVLEVTTKETYRQYGVNGSIWKFADIVTLTLVDCDTQTVIDSRTYYPKFPNKSDGSIKYETDAMEEWIQTSWEGYLAQNG